MFAQQVPKTILLEDVSGQKRVYDIKVVDHIKADVSDCGFIGYTYCEQQLIEIKKDLGKNDDAATVLTHELLHAINNCHGGPKEYHDFIYLVAPKLVILMKLNPDYVKLAEQTPVRFDKSTEDRYARVSSCAK